MGSGAGTLAPIQGSARGYPWPDLLARTNLGLIHENDADFDALDWYSHSDILLSIKTVGADKFLQLERDGLQPPAWLTCWLDTSIVPLDTTKIMVLAVMVTTDSGNPSRYFGPAVHLYGDPADANQDGVGSQTSIQRATPERQRLIEIADGASLGMPPGVQRNTDDDPRAFDTEYMQSIFVDGTGVVAWDFTDEALLSMTSDRVAGGAGFIWQNEDQTQYVKRFYAVEDRYLTVINLPSGYKAKVRDSEGVVLGEGTESGQTASIDMLKIDPAEAYDLIITDDGDVILSATAPVDGLWGGDEYYYPGGELGGTLPPIEVEATGSHSFAPSYGGAGAGILSVLLCLAAGTFVGPTFSGAGAGTLAPLTEVATGIYGYPVGAGVGTLSALTAQGEGTYAISQYSGTGSGTLPSLVGIGEGTIEYPGGQGAGDLPPLTGAATGTLGVPAYLGAGEGSLPVLTSQGTGTYAVPEYQGTGIATLPALTGTAAGTYAVPIYLGSGAGSLTPLTVSGTGTYVIPAYLGAGAGVLSPFTVSGEGIYGYPAGAGLGTLPVLTAQATGTLGPPQYTGAGVGTLTPLTVVGTGTYAIPVYSGAGAATLPALTSQATGVYGYPEGDGAGTLPSLTVLGIGTLSVPKYPGNGTGALCPIVCTGVGTYWAPSEFFYTDFSEYDDLSIPADWSPVITTHLSHLYDYLYREICDQISTRLGFIADRGKGTLGDTTLRRCTLAVDPEEEEQEDALAHLGHVVYWDYEWDTAGEIADGEIYARIRAQHRSGILFRSNYVWEFHFGTVDASFKMSSHNNDSTAGIGGFVYTFPAHQGKIYYYDWYNVRIRFVGTAIKMKIWRLGDVEPADWSIEGTDALWSTGKVGFSCIGNRLLAYGLDCLAVEASITPSRPFPPPNDFPDTPTKPTIASSSIDAYGNVTLECSTFLGDDDAYHLNTRWQVDLSTGDFSDPVVDTQYEVSAVGEIVIPTLPPDSYKARCLQRDSFEQETSWSDALPFTVSAREDPVTVDIRGLPGDVWVVQDLDDVVFRGLKTGGGTSSGPGGSGLATAEQYFDPHLGRYCRRLFVGGSNYQCTITELFGVSLRALLSSDTPKSSYTYILEDMCKVERILISQTPQANPKRTCFTGVHIDQAMNRYSEINGGHEYLALGFRTHNGANWQAYMTTYDIGNGGGVVKEIDTGKAEEDTFWWRIELDGWNKQIRWFVDDVLLTSYSPTAGVMDNYREGGRVNGCWCKGEHIFHFRAYPISVAYRADQGTIAI